MVTTSLRHRRQRANLVRSLLNFLHFFSAYSRIVLMVRIMARMRLPKAIVPKWKTWTGLNISQVGLVLNLFNFQSWFMWKWGENYPTAAFHMAEPRVQLGMYDLLLDQYHWNALSDDYMSLYGFVCFYGVWIMCNSRRSPLQRLRPGRAHQRLRRRRGPSRDQRRWSSGLENNSLFINNRNDVPSISIQQAMSHVYVLLIL